MFTKILLPAFALMFILLSWLPLFFVIVNKLVILTPAYQRFLINNQETTRESGLKQLPKTSLVKCSYATLKCDTVFWLQT